MKKIFYATQWIDESDIEAVAETLRSDLLTQGPKVDEFEARVADYCGAKYAVSVNSGTSALHIACLAAGIDQGDEVITSPITFVASANSVLYCGGQPVFADILPDTITIDPKEIAKKIAKKTKAIIPVHYAGHPCDMDEIQALADQHGLTIIEDAAHAMGAKYKGRKVGSISKLTILSFHAIKHITTGEGGIVLTDDAELRDRLVFFRSHGITRDPRFVKSMAGSWYYEMHELGLNYRLTEIQSALGISQLKKACKFLARRREIARIYQEAFADEPAIKMLSVKDYVEPSWHLFVILVKKRKQIFEALRAKGIIVNMHYIPIYRQPYYQKLGYGQNLCPKAEEFYAQAMSIPMYPKLSNEELEYVIKLIKEMVNEAK